MYTSDFVRLNICTSDLKATMFPRHIVLTYLVYLVYLVNIHLVYLVNICV